MKVAIIGLDCADPDLLFDELLDELPNLRALVERGASGRIRSSDPPTTVPAWSVFSTSKNPGRLGFTGFRNRAWRSTPKGKMATYDDAFLPTSVDVAEPTLWQLAGKAGRRSILVGVPQTFPPAPLDGCMVSGFLAPSAEAEYTYPSELADELEAEVGAWMPDVPDTNVEDTDQLVEEISAMTEQRFAAARHLATTREWDLLFLVAMGPDRVHHALWSAIDPGHALHEEADPEDAERLRAYYRALDDHVGELVDALPDETAILVVSDHGAKACHGTVALNDWLRREGYLVLEDDPSDLADLDPDIVDWSQTQAWARGGYVGRVHLNVQGREPQGAVDPADYEVVRDEIRRKLEALAGPDGTPLGTRVLKPQEVYAGERTDEAPDLLCYLGDLHWRATERVGHEDVLLPAGDGTSDEAVHDYQGVFVLADPEGRYTGEVDGLTLLDGTPTVLDLLDVPIPGDLEGRVLKPDGTLQPGS